jgi:hypothetical protein
MKALIQQSHQPVSSYTLELQSVIFQLMSQYDGIMEKIGGDFSTLNSSYESGFVLL